MARLPLFIGTALVALLLLGLSMFTVDQRQQALVFQLGEIKDVITEPGLNFKWPLIQNVKLFERRILTLDTPEPERFLTAEKKPVLVDSYVKWRIENLKQFYISVGDETLAKTRLSQTVNSGLREEFGKRTVHDVVSGEREKIMDAVKLKADAEARKIGVQIVDVRLKRVDLPPEVSESVYRRMETERKRVANELRSQGAAESEKIKASADRQREVIVAEANRDAQRLMGEGDAKATAVYAQAYGQNPEFFQFWRSMDANLQALRSKSDVIVVDANWEFFKYLKSSGGAAGKNGK